MGRSGSLAWRLDGAWAAGLYALRGQAGSVSGIAWTVGTYQQGPEGWKSGVMWIVLLMEEMRLTSSRGKYPIMYCTGF